MSDFVDENVQMVYAFIWLLFLFLLFAFPCCNFEKIRVNKIYMTQPKFGNFQNFFSEFHTHFKTYWSIINLIIPFYLTMRKNYFWDDTKAWRCDSKGTMLRCQFKTNLFSVLCTASVFVCELQTCVYTCILVSNKIKATPTQQSYISSTLYIFYRTGMAFVIRCSVDHTHAIYATKYVY